MGPWADDMIRSGPVQVPLAQGGQLLVQEREGIVAGCTVHER